MGLGGLDTDLRHSPLDQVCRLTHEPPAYCCTQLESRDDGENGWGSEVGFEGLGW